MLPHWMSYVVWGIEGMFYALALLAAVRAALWARR